MSAPAAPLAVTASCVCTPAGAAPATVLVEDGRIAGIEAARAGSRREIVAPGFLDLQVNGVDDVDCATASPDDLHRAGALLAATGVTAWLPTLVSSPLDHYAGPLARIDAARTGSPGAVVLGAHLEGPFLGGRPGAHRSEAVVDVDLDWLDALPDTVRLVTLAPEQFDAVAAIGRLVDRGVVVSLGHSAASIDQATAAVDAGATMVTHLFNAMGPLHHRIPGLAGLALADDRVVAGLIADLVHVHPALVRTAFRAKGPDRVALVTDAVGWLSGRVGSAGITLVDGAPRLSDGTLAGSVLTMDQAIRNAVDAAGVSPADAIRAASSTPASVLGEADRGRVEVGARADLVVLDADDLSVTRTMVAGRTVFES